VRGGDWIRVESTSGNNQGPLAPLSFGTIPLDGTSTMAEFGLSLRSHHHRQSEAPVSLVANIEQPSLGQASSSSSSTSDSTHDLVFRVAEHSLPASGQRGSGEGSMETGVRLGVAPSPVICSSRGTGNDIQVHSKAHMAAILPSFASTPMDTMWKPNRIVSAWVDISETYPLGKLRVVGELDSGVVESCFDLASGFMLSQSPLGA